MCELWPNLKLKQRYNIFNNERSLLQSTNTIFGVAILRNEFSRFAKYLRGGQAWYGAVSAFLVDSTIMLSHLKLSSKI